MGWRYFIRKKVKDPSTDSSHSALAMRVYSKLTLHRRTAVECGEISLFITDEWCSIIQQGLSHRLPDFFGKLTTGENAEKAQK